MIALRKLVTVTDNLRTEYKELSVPTPLLIQPDRQGFSYANPANRNPPPDAELYNQNLKQEHNKYAKSFPLSAGPSVSAPHRFLLRIRCRAARFRPLLRG